MVGHPSPYGLTFISAQMHSKLLVDLNNNLGHNNTFLHVWLLICVIDVTSYGGAEFIIWQHSRTLQAISKMHVTNVQLLSAIFYRPLFISLRFNLL